MAKVGRIDHPAANANTGATVQSRGRTRSGSALAKSKRSDRAAERTARAVLAQLDVGRAEALHGNATPNATVGGRLSPVPKAVSPAREKRLEEAGQQLATANVESGALANLRAQVQMLQDALRRAGVALPGPNAKSAANTSSSGSAKASTPAGSGEGEDGGREQVPGAKVPPHKTDSFRGVTAGGHRRQPEVGGGSLPLPAMETGPAQSPLTSKPPLSELSERALGGGGARSRKGP